MFGLYSAIGVVVSAVFLFLFLPAALQMFPLVEEAASAGNSASTLIDPAFLKGWHRVGGWIIDHNKLVTAVLPGRDGVYRLRHDADENVGAVDAALLAEGQGRRPTTTGSRRTWAS